jgi:hypothetical protein
VKKESEPAEKLHSLSFIIKNKFIIIMKNIHEKIEQRKVKDIKFKKIIFFLFSHFPFIIITHHSSKLRKEKRLLKAA